MTPVVPRIRSLDIFRGLTVALMILVNNPGTGSHIYAPLMHAEWHGLTPTDLIFPFFLFAVGNALALIKLDPGKIFRRTLLIFGIGLLLNWSPFVLWNGDDLILKTWTWINPQGQEMGVRIPGVLQRIAIAYGFAATLIYLAPRRALLFAFLILVLSTGLALGFGVWGHALDPWSAEGFYGTAIDRTLLGNVHLYQGDGPNFDPEGIMSSLAPIAQVLIGYWAGLRLTKSTGSLHSILSGLLKSAIALLTFGYLWSVFQPINKKIWTSSYTLVTSGWAVLVLITIEAWMRQPTLENSKMKELIAHFFEVFGRNPLFIFVLSGFLPRLINLIRIGDLTPRKWFYAHFCALLPGPPENGSLFYAVLIVLFYWWIASFLDRKRIYIRV